MPRPKIQVTESTVGPLHFIDIYIPILNKDDPREVIIDHHEKYLHVFIPTEGKPTYKRRGQPTSNQYFDEILFGNYAFVDFWERVEHEIRMASPPEEKWGLFWKGNESRLPPWEWHHILSPNEEVLEYLDVSGGKRAHTPRRGI